MFTFTYYLRPSFSKKFTTMFAVHLPAPAKPASLTDTDPTTRSRRSKKPCFGNLLLLLCGAQIVSTRTPRRLPSSVLGSETVVGSAIKPLVPFSMAVCRSVYLRRRAGKRSARMGGTEPTCTSKPWIYEYLLRANNGGIDQKLFWSTWPEPG